MSLNVESVHHFTLFTCKIKEWIFTPALLYCVEKNVAGASKTTVNWIKYLFVEHYYAIIIIICVHLSWQSYNSSHALEFLWSSSEEKYKRGTPLVLGDTFRSIVNRWGLN